MVDGSGVAVIVSAPVGVGVAVTVGTLVLGATVTVGVDVGWVACDPHPSARSTVTAASAAPPRNRMRER